MVPVMELWLPILLSAVVVFIASSLIHMLLGYHKGDLEPLPDEQAASAALRGVPPGDYALPYAGSMGAMKDPAFVSRVEAGPVAILTVMKPGKPNMAPQFAQWFALSLVISIFAAYMASRGAGAAADYGSVFRFAATTAFLGYSFALVHDSIWFKRKWSTTLKYMLDGLIYGLLTGGVFGWLWPGI